MTILGQMKKENSTIIEHKLNDKYYLFIEGLNENNEATNDTKNVKRILVELFSQENDYMDTMDSLLFTPSTNLEELTVEFVQKHIGYLLD